MISKIKNNILEIQVNDNGAELSSIKRVGDSCEYLWQADPAFWARKAPVLFPIVGKLLNNKYTVGKKEYIMTQHGFARDMDFKLVSQTPDSLSYELENSLDLLKKYPFSFKLIITYTIKGNELTMSYDVCNTDVARMWFSIGSHPGFNCPLLPGERMEDYSIVFEKKETLNRTILENGLLTSEEPLLNNQNVLPLSQNLFERDVIILKGLKSQYVILKNSKNKKQVKIDFKGFPYLGIWSKPSGAPFVCIEPWFGIASSKTSKPALKDKEGIISFLPGDVFHCQVKITID
ncbi:MAG TPA: aldose epimerase [Lentisphaeria bacterium]|nr:MAG: hypothetical protein A2X45_05670 [Lentisphaerae bacterium GWF2_50_93]HCE44748.1 aldose epimerase [Lentisphaeria bacterium]